MRWIRAMAGLLSFSCFAACLVPVTDEVATERAPIVDGTACARSCRAASTDECDWQSQCDPNEWPPIACCAGRFITCLAAEHAHNDGAWGLEWCYRDCENLH